MATKRKQAIREAFIVSRFTNPSGDQFWRVSGTGKDGKRVRKNFKTELAEKQTLEIGDQNRWPRNRQSNRERA